MEPHVPPELVPVLGAIGGAGALLIRTAAKWLLYKIRRARIARESREGPEFGTPGWLWKEIVRERGARHAVQHVVTQQGERIAALEAALRAMGASPYRGGTVWHESGEQERPRFSSSGSYPDNDTDKDPAPPFEVEEPRTPAEGPAARRRMRSRP